MNNRRSSIFRASDNPPKLSYDNESESELIDDDDDCIICGKLLLEHSEDEANQCYSTLTKKQLFKKQLSKRKVKT